MKRKIVYPLLLVLCIGLVSCGEGTGPTSETLVKINEYEMPLEEYQRQLKAELELDEHFKVTQEAKRDFLEDMITKELLVQEAKRLKLDRREPFVHAIERYWESTLIRDLMDLKAKEIGQRTVVSEEEIESQYKSLKKEEPNCPPLDQIREKIHGEALEKKKRMVLKRWVESLRSQAKVEVNEHLLYEK
jgi:hypothetical protein